MIIRLPFPDAALMPNRSKGRHWASLSALRAQRRSDAFYATKAAMPRIPRIYTCGETVALNIYFGMPDRRHRDLDNLLSALKPDLDGVADALGVNDRQFKPLLIDWDLGEKPGGVLVTVGDFQIAPR